MCVDAQNHGSGSDQAGNPPEKAGFHMRQTPPETQGGKMTEPKHTDLDTEAEARMVADLTATFMRDLEKEGWSQAAILSGVSSGALARTAGALGPAFAASLCDRAADQLRGGMGRSHA